MLQLTVRRGGGFGENDSWVFDVASGLIGGLPEIQFPHL